MACTLQLRSLPVYMLFYYGVMCSFDPNKLVEKLGKNPCGVEKKGLYKYFLGKKCKY